MWVSNLTKTPFIIISIAIVSFGLTVGVVYAGAPAVTHTGDVLIQQDTPGTGRLSIVDNNLGIRTPAAPGFEARIRLRDSETTHR